MLNKKDSIAVIDIGSNSVRLCVFRGNMRSPDVLYNKKFFCGLGEYLPKTKLISKEAEKKCINSIIFFNSIIEEIKPNHSVALCTAAIRNASNKKQITNKIQKVFKGKVLTLSGRQEASYATLGVRSAIPRANGTIIDMGGGSLELAQITPHKIKNISSFPLGILNFTKEHKEHKKINKEINSKHKNQKIFYLIGGAFRTIARCYIYFNKLPFNEIHNLSISRKNFYELKSELQKIGIDDLQKIPKISVDRIKHIHIAIEVLDKVLKLSNCEQFIYPRYGIREGFIYENLPKKQRLLDPTEISLELIDEKKIKDELGEEITYKELLNNQFQGYGELSSRTPFVRMWTAISIADIIDEELEQEMMDSKFWLASGFDKKYGLDEYYDVPGLSGGEQVHLFRKKQNEAITEHIKSLRGTVNYNMDGVRNFNKFTNETEKSIETTKIYQITNFEGNESYQDNMNPNNSVQEESGWAQELEDNKFLKPKFFIPLAHSPIFSDS